MYYTKRFNKLRVLEIIGLYNNDGLSVNKIALRFKCNYRTIYDILKKNKVCLRTASEAQLNRYSESDINDIIELHKNGTSIREISKKLSLSRSRCSGILKRNGHSTYFDKRVYRVNDNFFKVIDNESKAYWLGFILADGCVYKNKVIIGLSKKDHNHIEKFKKDIRATHPIKNLVKNGSFGKKKTFLSEIRVSSKQMVKDLKEHGITERKTLSVVVPDIDDQLLVHFWRGVLDGDGWIGKYKKQSVVGLCNNYNIVNEFSKFISNRLNFKYRKPSSHKSIYKIVYCGKGNPQKIARLLYGGSSVFLDRKMSISEDIIKGDVA